MPGSTCLWNGAAYVWWDANGKILRETKMPSEPEVLVWFFSRLGLPVTQIGLEAGPLSQWLHAGLTKARLATVLLETRQARISSGGDRGGEVLTERDQAAAAALVETAQFHGRRSWMRLAR